MRANTVIILYISYELTQQNSFAWAAASLKVIFSNFSKHMQIDLVNPRQTWSYP